MRIPSARSVPLAIRLPIAALIVVLCALPSLEMAIALDRPGRNGTTTAVGIVAGLYMVMLRRKDFLKLLERRGVWASLLIVYAVRVAYALASLASLHTGVTKLFHLDFAIGRISAAIGAPVLQRIASQSPSVVTFGVTLLDALLQHLLIAILFGLVLAIVKPHAADPTPEPAEPRGFDMLKPDSR
jgi:hypothetical protein